MGAGKSREGGDGSRPRQNSDSLHRLEKELEREAARNAPPVEVTSVEVRRSSGLGGFSYIFWLGQHKKGED
jgi:hypothetical protein